MKPLKLKTVCLICIAAALAAFAIGCAREVVEEQFQPSQSHRRYRKSLEHFGLLETALGRDWVHAAETALSDPVTVEVPFLETAMFDAGRAEAVGYRFKALQGQRITVTLEFEEPAGPTGEITVDRHDEDAQPAREILEVNDGLKVFADVFRVDNNGSEPLEQVASYSEALNRLEFEPRRDREYILRLQPELLRGGRFRVTIETEPSLSFPVQDHGPEHIYSFFGSPRDGGARVHEGVDVFAPRGTPVAAAAPAVVRRVGTRERGGKVVSLYDEERDLIYYYAHLDEQLTEGGQRVEPGDIIGTVGNTGNARTTPPHLHFGIYEARWNAVDPWYYLYDKGQEPLPPSSDLELIGAWARVNAEEAPVFTSLGGTRETVTTVGPDAEFKPVGAAGEYYRIRLSNGAYGHVSATVVSAAQQDLDR